MLLGDIIRNLTDAQGAARALALVGDPVFVSRVETAAQAGVESAGDYAARAVARFADGAGDEDWVTLMGRLERTDDPAAACLRAMIDWSLKQDAAPAEHACGCGHEH